MLKKRTKNSASLFVPHPFQHVKNYVFLKKNSSLNDHIIYPLCEHQQALPKMNVTLSYLD